MVRGKPLPYATRLDGPGPAGARARTGGAVPRRRAGALALLLLAIPVAGAIDSDTPQPAVLAPLAARSLLLGVTTLADGHVVAVGERGHVLVSDDAGHSWRQSPVPVSSTLTAVYFADALHGWAVGHDETILRTDNGGRRWQLSHFAPTRQQPLLGVWFDAAGHGLAVGAFATVYRSADGGRSWQPAGLTPFPVRRSNTQAWPPQVNSLASASHSPSSREISWCGHIPWKARRSPPSRC